MTDAVAGRGGVGIRLFTTGGEVVRRNFDQIGDSGKRMWAEIALGQRSANPAIRALSIGVGEAKQGIQGLASQAGGAGMALGAFGAAGLAAAAVLGALAGAMIQTREAMQFSADLTDAADRIGVGVEALQQWRYVADEAGVGTSEFESSLESLNGKLGAFKSGVGDARLKPVFEQLGITKEALADVQTADQLMMILADTLGQVQDRATQVKFAQALGVEASLPALRMGSVELKRLMDAASDTGLVLDKDLVARLDEADRKMEIANAQFKVMTYEAVEPLATSLAGAASYLGALSAEFRQVEGQLPGLIQQMLALGRSMPGFGTVQRVGEWAAGYVLRNRPKAAHPGGAGLDMGERGVDEDDPMIIRQRMAQAGASPAAFAPLGNAGSGRSGGRSGGSSAASQRQREAERLERDRERALAELDREEVQARRARTRLMWDGDTPADRAQMAQSLLALDIAERDRKREDMIALLTKSGALTESTQINLDQLKMLDEETDRLAMRAIVEERTLAEAREQLQHDRDISDNTIAMLRNRADLAATEGERFQINRQILLAEQELERKVLEAGMRADGVVSPAEQERYDKTLSRQQSDITVLDADEDNRLRDQFKGYGREIVSAIEGGRIGEYIGDRLKERLLDGGLNALFDMLNNAGSQKGGGGGGFWGTVLNLGASLLGARAPVGTINPGLSTPGFTGGGWFGGGLASGGAAKAGFHYRMAEHGTPELLMLGGQGQVANMAQMADMLKSSGMGIPSQDGGASIVVNTPYSPNIVVNGSGPEIDALRRELAAERANFRSNVVETVNDALQRRQIAS